MKMCLQYLERETFETRLLSQVVLPDPELLWWPLDGPFPLTAAESLTLVNA